jgi:hypothetical protein
MSQLSNCLWSEAVVAVVVVLSRHLTAAVVVVVVSYGKQSQLFLLLPTQ